ncbi:poly-beta-1,6-N-acetyl-D-glucosamine N-deacetylase PgaB [Acinetobacter sp. ANC 4862]|uniref:poly-beta-1,6-N-acetyl-D-glucosamine N-deacetylase PgaB n=1 Tax=Acinetobacter sp. ANC 4862 TaxID=2529849 RepID=UPI001039D6B6|nr:poly-beta-1,6-N-acetyl-D-glucosamine N-deacetylase PgaB [Acinetobacter sp. ANC 4862]TCH62916.1 poly-beta-1,6-N-acetyl-D-glucosamine N-deacetylase PgaB [Acinetobacter sp. ANC 4862]
MTTRLLSTLLSTSLSAVLWQIPHLAWSQKPAHNPTLTVIGYHEIINTENALIPEYAVSSTQFQQHIDWLKKNGFHFINVDQLIQAHQGKYSLPTKPVLLTVDDGYASFYKNAYPIVKANKIPVVLAVVGSWLEPKEDQSIDFSGEQIQRKDMLSWSELKEMQDSGLVEIASHSYNLHRGIVGNPQGNLEPAAVTRLYDAKSASYEDDSHYQQRISNDLKQNNQLLIAHGLKSPRVMVWPYGHYNMQTVKIAKQLGMPVAISLDDGADSAKSSLGQLNRILIEGNMTTTDLAREIQNRQQHLGDNNRPQKIMHIDLDYIYDKDPIQQERNLDHLLDRIVAMKVNTVYLQAFSDPDANGSADMVYFPNHYLPMRADLFNRVAWQIQTRTQVGRVYAWMPLLAWELPKNNPVSKDVVETQQKEDSEHLNMGYRRLSPFSPDARKTISGIYQDLAKSVPFNGILFHDDTTLSDYEDASPEALKAYAAIGLPTDLAEIRSNDAELQKWTAYKTKYIDDFALQLAQQVRQYHPFLLTARNLYAQVALKPYAENWYSQSLEQSINRYDFTAIMAMPYMEQAPNSDVFYRDIVNRVKQFPQGIKKTVFELQAVNWRSNQKVPSDEMASTIQSLYQQGAMHVAYYPDDPIQDHPNAQVLRQAFDLKSSKLVP